MLGIGVRVQAVDFVVSLRDQILVLGTAAVGSVSIVAYWGLVLRVLQAPAMLLWTLVRVSFPAMSRTRSAGGDPGSMLPRLLPAATILAGTLLVPLAGAAPALVPLLFGHRWSPAADALSVACLAVVIHTPLMIAGQSYLWTAGDAKTPLRAMIADAVVCVAVGLPLVPILGVLGLAIGGVAAAVCSHRDSRARRRPANSCPRLSPHPPTGARMGRCCGRSVGLRPGSRPAGDAGSDQQLRRPRSLLRAALPDPP